MYLFASSITSKCEWKFLLYPDILIMVTDYSAISSSKAHSKTFSVKNFGLLRHIK